MASSLALFWEVELIESLNPSFCVQITKKRASHKPTYENLQKSLEAMKSHCLKNGVTDLSMPRQGNGRLNWLVRFGLRIPFLLAVRP